MDEDVPEEFDPLLPVGRHVMTMAELHALCVTPFVDSVSRPLIMSGLTSVVDRIASSNLIGELWVDGSFTTKKVDPEDVDIVLRMSGEVFDACTEAQIEVANWINSDLHDTHKCHSFVYFYWPEGHQFYWDGEGFAPKLRLAPKVGKLHLNSLSAFGPSPEQEGKVGHESANRGTPKQSPLEILGGPWLSPVDQKPPDTRCEH